MPELTSDMIDFQKLAKSLKEKKQSVYFTKAYKSNNIVIFNKDDYVETTEAFIQSGPYQEVSRDPLQGMIRRTNQAIKKTEKVFEEEEFFTQKFHVSNASIPKISIKIV